MNRDVQPHKLTARFTIAQLWNRLLDKPIKDVVDALQLEKERLLDRIFLGHDIGRWIYNRTDANWWTSLRRNTCWIPPLLILVGWGLTGFITWVLIWSTDIIDGWFARKKQQESLAGMRRETRVDTVYNILMFVAVYLRYPEMRTLVAVASGGELLRLSGALYMIWNGFTPKPNRSGKAKTCCYAAGVGLQLLVPGPLVHLIMQGGIVLSGYSMLAHWIEYQGWKRALTPRH